MSESTINRLIVDLDAIRYNIDQLKKISKAPTFYAVVKADAYGLGAVEIMKAIDDRVDGYCVSSIEEGIELRQAGTRKEILNLGYTPLSLVERASKNAISIAIYDLDYSRKIEKILAPLGLTIVGHIKLDTGHGRLGFRKSDKSLDQIVEIAKLKSIRLEGVFSHLATADERDTSFTKEQEEIFDYMLNHLEDRGLVFAKKHLANDAGFIKHKISYDLVRSGICIYGLYPSDLLKEEGEVDLKEVFEWHSQVSFVKEVEKGASISYGRTFIADRKMRVATLAIGYADGYKRANSNRGFVLIRGKKAPVIGRVTMDQTMVDVTEIDGVEIGDDVILIGKSEDLSISADDLAQWQDTISYEIITSISKRVSRIYVEG